MGNRMTPRAGEPSHPFPMGGGVGRGRQVLKARTRTQNQAQLEKENILSTRCTVVRTSLDKNFVTQI